MMSEYPALTRFINSASYPVGMIFMLELENVNPWVEIEGLRVYNVCMIYWSCIKCNRIVVVEGTRG